MALASRSQGADGRTVARPAIPLDDRLLRAAFQDLLGRPPFEDERERWLGRSLRELAAEVVGQLEFWQHWLDEELYGFLLIDNFRPRSERVLAIPGDLAEGRLDPREAVHRIALSPSFELRNPGADTFVTVVLEQLAGVVVQENTRELDIGKRLYDGNAGLFLGESGASQADVVRIAVESKRFARTFTARQYERLLGRPPPAKQLAADARELRQDPRRLTDLVRRWLVSPAYEQRVTRRRVQPNRYFVRSLFVDLLGRLPTPAEAEPLREALDGMGEASAMRGIVARLLLDSGEVVLPPRGAIRSPREWVDGLFRRLLGRPAGPEELAAFTEALGDPACRPATIVQALVTHPEYQRY